MCINLRTYHRAFQMQEATSAAYFTHYTNLFGSLSHQALARDLFGWCGCRWCSTDPSSNSRLCITTTLTWGSLKDNSVCCQIFWTAVLADIASKVTRVRTLANMLAAAPLASSMFSDWGRQAAGWGSISQALLPLQLGKGPFLPTDASKRTWDDLPCPTSTSTIECSSMSARIWRMDWICPPSPGSSWTPMNAAGVSLALCTVHSETHQSDWGWHCLRPARLELSGNLTTCILPYYTNDYCIIMTVEYMTVAHTMLAPINEQLINFVYSLLLLFIVHCRLFHVYIALQWAWAFMSLAKEVRINWLLTYFEMSRHTRHYLSA